jgi:hypothetical protein
VDVLDCGGFSYADVKRCQGRDGLLIPKLMDSFTKGRETTTTKRERERGGRQGNKQPKKKRSRRQKYRKVSLLLFRPSLLCLFVSLTRSRERERETENVLTFLEQLSFFPLFLSYFFCYLLFCFVFCCSQFAVVIVVERMCVCVCA